MIDKNELIEILETLQDSGDIQFIESNKVDMVERYLINKNKCDCKIKEPCVFTEHGKIVEKCINCAKPI